MCKWGHVSPFFIYATGEAVTIHQSSNKQGVTEPPSSNKQGGVTEPPSSNKQGGGGGHRTPPLYPKAFEMCVRDLKCMSQSGGTIRFNDIISEYTARIIGCQLRIKNLQYIVKQKMCRKF